MSTTLANQTLLAPHQTLLVPHNSPAWLYFAGWRGTPGGSLPTFIDFSIPNSTSSLLHCVYNAGQPDPTTQLTCMAIFCWVDGHSMWKLMSELCLPSFTYSAPWLAMEVEKTKMVDCCWMKPGMDVSGLDVAGPPWPLPRLPAPAGDLLLSLPTDIGPPFSSLTPAQQVGKIKSC